MTYEEASKITSDKTELLRFMFEDIDEGTFNRIFEIIIHNRFLKNYIDKPYFFQKIIKSNKEKAYSSNNKYKKELLVALNEYDATYDGFVQLHPRIFVLPEYYMSGRTGSLSEIYVRESVIEDLLDHLDLLPEDYAIRVYDGYRTLECQKDIYDQVFQEVKEIERQLPEYMLKKEEFLNDHIRNDIMPSYICEPLLNPPFPHNTGGEIDCRICDINGIDLNYGCLYDEISERSKMDFFEDKMDNNEYLDDYQLEALLNRRVTANLFKYPTSNKKLNTKQNALFSPFATEDWFSISDIEGIEIPNYGSCDKEKIIPNPKYTINDYIKDNK